MNQFLNATGSVSFIKYNRIDFLHETPTCGHLLLIQVNSLRLFSQMFVLYLFLQIKEMSPSLPFLCLLGMLLVHQILNLWYCEFTDAAHSSSESHFCIVFGCACIQGVLQSDFGHLVLFDHVSQHSCFPFHFV